MAKMFLEESESITGIVHLYRVDGESVSEPVWADPVSLARFGIDQLRQASLFGTFSYYLPGAMPVDTKYDIFISTFYRSTTQYVVFEHLLSIVVNWQRSYFTPFLLFSDYVLYL
jgi:hypothetical protein